MDASQPNIALLINMLGCQTDDNPTYGATMLRRLMGLTLEHENHRKGEICGYYSGPRVLCG